MSGQRDDGWRIVCGLLHRTQTREVFQCRRDAAIAQSLDERRHVRSRDLRVMVERSVLAVLERSRPSNVGNRREIDVDAPREQVGCR